MTDMFNRVSQLLAVTLPRTLSPDEITLALDDAGLLSEVTGTTSDGHHTFNELYEYRMLYNAHAAHGWRATGIPVTKSWRHSDGEECFGGGWFIVTAQLLAGQVSNHYEAKYWGLFKVPEIDIAPAWDGHTPADAAKRLRIEAEHTQPVRHARTAPTREQIEAVLGRTDDRLCAPDVQCDDCKTIREHYADAVLALITDQPTIAETKAQALEEEANHWAGVAGGIIAKLLNYRAEEIRNQTR